MVLRLDSVVFSTPALAMVREFYSNTLGLPVATYMKDGSNLPDESEHYVNFDCGGVILGFEKGDNVQTGTVVLMTKNFTGAVQSLASKNVLFTKQTDLFAIFPDPEGREIILQREE